MDKFASQDRFDEATTAIRNGEFKRAREILEEIITVLQDSTDDEKDSDLAIARSELEMVTVREELAKPRRERNVDRIASAYEAAARQSIIPSISRSIRRARVEALSKWYTSNARKYQAFTLLNDETIQENPEAILTKSKELLDDALAFAQEAIKHLRDGTIPKNHIDYLHYWSAILGERIGSLSYMRTGDISYFDAAMQSLEEALIRARKFSEDRLFPNRYVSLRELELEPLLLSAARAFRENNWGECISLLESWLADYPIVHMGSWRTTQIKLRILLAKALKAHSSNDKETFRAISNQLDDIKEPLGRAGDLLAIEIKRLCWVDTPMERPSLDLLCQLFPLDSTIQSFDKESIDEFWSLPKRIYEWLVQSGMPSTILEVEESKMRVTGAVEALLIYICDYYAQYVNWDDPLPEDWEQLIMSFESITSRLEGREYRSLLVKEAGEKLNTLREATDVGSYRASYSDLVETLRKICGFTPVIVEFKENRGTPEENSDYLVVEFDWYRHEELSRQNIGYVKYHSGQQLEGRAYLPPKWRKGNIPCYVVSEKNPLFSVQHEPDWGQLEKQIITEQWLKSHGISWGFLLEAIELARDSKPEKDLSKPKLYVGAIIVKDGKIISKASRNEDNTGKHAEEIAIEKVRERGEQDKLQGAIAITTLEPCVHNARHGGNMGCAILLQNYGIGKVIIGMLDPHKTVRGKGELTLLANGIEVLRFPPILEKQIRELNREFEEHYTRKRSLVAVDDIEETPD